jgi:MFS family permease
MCAFADGAGAGQIMRDPATPPPSLDYLHHAAARRIIVGILLTMLLAALDQVMVATALPSIAASLGDFDNLSWIVTANLLSGTAATPFYGKLSDIYGRRAMMLIAIGIYAAGSLACALAPTMLALILARALQGLGGGGLMPLVQTIIGDVASPRDRPRYQGYTSATFILSTVGGPLIGGFIAQHFHWSWIFWLNLPLCALAYVLTHNVLQELPRHERPHRLDLLGAVLMVGAAIPLMLALTWGGRRYGWGAPEILGLFLVSAILWACFAWRMMTAVEPFIPIAVLRDGAMCVGTASGFFAVGTMIALSIIQPLYAQAPAAGRRSHELFSRRRARPPDACRVWSRPDFSLHRRRSAERGCPAPARRRDRRDEFLPCAWSDIHRYPVRRDRACRKSTHARHVICSGSCRYRPKRLSLCLCYRRSLPWRCSRLCSLP